MKIRLWQLGSLEHKIFPSQESLQKLRKLLTKAKNEGDEVVDLIWGPELTCKIIDVEDGVEDYVLNPKTQKLEKIS